MHKVTVNKIAASTFDVVANVEKEVWKASQEKAFEKLAKNIKIDGFRPGKAPKEMLKKNIDQGRLFNEAINGVIQDVFKAALEESKLNPFTQPTVDVTKISDDELELVFHQITMPEVKLGQYKDFGFELEVPAVTEEEVEKGVQEHLKDATSLVLAERESKLGDTVVIDFDGYVDGKQFDGGKADNYNLELGSNTFIPGFEDQLIGHKAGDEVEVKVTFPKEYVEHLAGKDAIFKCKVHEVKEKVLPELNDETVAELNIPGVKTVTELYEHERGHVLSHKEAHAKEEVMNKIIEKILENATIEEIPEAAIAEEAKYIKQNLVNRLAQQGLDLPKYLELTGKSEEDYNKELNESALKSLRYGAVMSQVRKEEKLELTDEEVEFELAKMAEQYKMELPKLKEILAPQMDNFKSDLLNKKMQDFLLEANTK